jgi:hypothetical protein
MHTILTATEINRLAQRLSQPPLGRSASAAAAAERFQRLLAAKIGPARAADAARAILAAPGFEPAEGRLVAEIGADAPSMAGEPPPAADPAPAAIPRPAPPSKPAAAPAAEPNPQRRRRDADLEAKARQGQLPPPPDFSAPTHVRYRSKLEGLIALAERGDAEALTAITINPVSSSPKALARYRDLCITALEARGPTKA